MGDLGHCKNSFCFETCNQWGHRLAALLLRSGHVGLVVSKEEPTCDAGAAKLFALFPLLRRPIGAIEQALLFMAPPSWHLTALDVQMEARWLFTNVQQNGDIVLDGLVLPLPQSSSSSSPSANQSVVPSSFYHWNQFLMGNTSTCTVPDSTLHQVKSLLTAVGSVQINAIMDDCVDNDTNASNYNNCQELNTTYLAMVCGVCQQALRKDSVGAEQFVVLDHSSNNSSPCFIHSGCIRAPKRCPLHPRFNIRRCQVFTSSSSSSLWHQMTTMSTPMPLFISSIALNGWSVLTVDLLNILCDNIQSRPLGRSSSDHSMFIQRELIQLNESGSGPLGSEANDLSQFGDSPSWRLARAALYLAAKLDSSARTSSSLASFRMRCAAALFIATERRRLSLSHAQTRQSLNREPRLSPAVNASAYKRLVRVGGALLEWPLLFRAIMEGNLLFSWHVACQSLTVANILLIRSRVELDWRRVGLIIDDGDKKTCEKCNQKVAINDESNQLVIVGDNHWWCHQCRSIQHEIINVGDIDLNGVPSIGLTCYICCLLQMLVCSAVLRKVFFDQFLIENGWSFSLPKSAQEADRALLNALAVALHSLYSPHQHVTAQQIVDIKSALANTINFDYYHRKEQPITEVLLAVVHRLEDYLAPTNCLFTIHCHPINEENRSRQRSFVNEFHSSLPTNTTTSQANLFIVERHGPPPFDSLPLQLNVNGTPFLLMAFTIRLVVDDSAHFITYRRNNNDNWFQCDNHQVKSINSLSLDDDNVLRQSDLAVYERRRVRIAERENGGQHPDLERPKTTRSGRESKRVKKS